MLLLLSFLALSSAVHAAPADIHDIRGPLPPEAMPPFVPTGVWLAVLAGIFVLHRRRQTIAELPAPEPPPDARMALSRLVAEYREGACLPDLVCIRLDVIVRDAVAAGGAIRAHHLTSIELRREAATHLAKTTRTALDEILSLCDLVKFAGRQLSPAEIDGALVAAERLVDELVKGDGS